jgi:hypothetical protein
VKRIQRILSLTLILIITVTALFTASCSDENATLNLPGAVEKVSSSATGLTIESYTNGQKVTIEKNNPQFDAIIDYLKRSDYDRSQPRYQEINGEITEIKIPYKLKYALVFKLTKGSDITFDYGFDKLWFTAKEMLYGATIDMGLGDTLQQIVKD